MHVRSRWYAHLSGNLDVTFITALWPNLCQHVPSLDTPRISGTVSEQFEQILRENGFPFLVESSLRSARKCPARTNYGPSRFESWFRHTHKAQSRSFRRTPGICQEILASNTHILAKLKSRIVWGLGISVTVCCFKTRQEVTSGHSQVPKRGPRDVPLFVSVLSSLDLDSSHSARIGSRQD